VISFNSSSTDFILQAVVEYPNEVVSKNSFLVSKLYYNSWRIHKHPSFDTGFTLISGGAVGFYSFTTRAVGYFSDSGYKDLVYKYNDITLKGS
jgi:hypothetical protein